MCYRKRESHDVDAEEVSDSRQTDKMLAACCHAVLDCCLFQEQMKSTVEHKQSMKSDTHCLTDKMIDMLDKPEETKQYGNGQKPKRCVLNLPRHSVASRKTPLRRFAKSILAFF